MSPLLQSEGGQGVDHGETPWCFPQRPVGLGREFLMPPGSIAHPFRSIGKNASSSSFAIFTARFHWMTPRIARLSIIACVALHTLMLAAYSFPQAMVPERLRVIGQWYARPVFHQQWKLFAPDPPRCACALQVRSGEGEWRDVEHGAQHYLERRMARSLCRYIQTHGEHSVPGARAVVVALTHAARPEASAFRIVEHCVTDPWRPADRSTRITPLFAP